MLQCLVVAVRPLDVEELAELLAFEFDASQGGIPKYHPVLRLDDQTQAVLSTCSSLVTIINKNSSHPVVQFSHFSVKEFLLSNRLMSSLGDLSRYHIRLKSAHTVLTQACLGSLLHDHITPESVDCRRARVAHHFNIPLVIYAARHWVEHAQFEDVASHLRDGIITLFDPNKPHFEAWVDIYDIESSVYGQYDSELRNPLYYAVLCEFYDVIEHLVIKHPHYINVACGKLQFPLFAAVFNNNIKVAELLLEHDANVEARDPRGETILLKVLSTPQCNLVNKVKVLLKYGADVNARDGISRSSLHLAEYHGKQEVVQMLLKHKADVNSQDIHGKTPLHTLLGTISHFKEDEDDIFNHLWLLLEHGVDVNRRDKDNNMPLLLVMEWKWFRIARIFLEHGADANVKNNNGMTALRILSEICVDSVAKSGRGL
jgi:ankyrin repeat protein